MSRRVPHGWVPRLTAAIAVAALAPLSAADQVADRQAEVSVKTVTEDAAHGRLATLSITEGALIHTDGGEDQRIPFADLVRITTTVTVSQHGRRDVTLSLAGGDVLYGRLVGARDESVVVETTDLGNIAVPLESITRIDSARAGQPAYRESVKWFQRAADADEDRILLTNGDVIDGFVTGIDADGVSIESSFGETTVPHRLVVVVCLASSPPPQPDGPHLILTFRSSGRITVTGLRWSGNVVEARLHLGEQIRIEAERVVRVDVVGGKWEWLSTHRPISYQHTPMLSLGWEYANDRNVLGGPITVAGATFEHGVGVHSRSKLTYDLKGAYREFVTYFGIDDDSGPHADVSAYILVDGKPRFEKTDVRRGTLHGPVRLDVIRANRIELVVDFGQNGDLQDRFNWIEPALIRP
ncbi:MAG: NPCBM/NEW2 domain-containing protein [Phycisphaerales bacterium]|nr:MAG: NPCBM/NEW2 domain-containing protein [Phycisphaerales bacterium]